MSEDFENPGCFLALFEVLSIFDWVSPTIAIGKTARHAVKKRSPFEQWTFYFPIGAAAKAGWSMYHIRKYLKENGVNIIAENSFFDEAALAVDLDDAAQAELLLDLAGVPMKEKGRGAPRR